VPSPDCKSGKASTRRVLGDPPRHEFCKRLPVPAFLVQAPSPPTTLEGVYAASRERDDGNYEHNRRRNQQPPCGNATPERASRGRPPAPGSRSGFRADDRMQEGSPISVGSRGSRSRSLPR